MADNIKSALLDGIIHVGASRGWSRPLNGGTMGLGGTSVLQGLATTLFEQTPAKDERQISTLQGAQVRRLSSKGSLKSQPKLCNKRNSSEIVRTFSLEIFLLDIELQYSGALIDIKKLNPFKQLMYSFHNQFIILIFYLYELTLLTFSKLSNSKNIYYNMLSLLSKIFFKIGLTVVKLSWKRQARRLLSFFRPFV